MIDLSSTLLEGSLPLDWPSWPLALRRLDLSSTQVSGPVPLLWQSWCTSDGIVPEVNVTGVLPAISERTPVPLCLFGGADRNKNSLLVQHGSSAQLPECEDEFLWTFVLEETDTACRLEPVCATSSQSSSWTTHKDSDTAFAWHLECDTHCRNNTTSFHDVGAPVPSDPPPATCTTLSFIAPEAVCDSSESCLLQWLQPLFASSEVESIMESLTGSKLSYSMLPPSELSFDSFSSCNSGNVGMLEPMFLPMPSDMNVRNVSQSATVIAISVCFIALISLLSACVMSKRPAVDALRRSRAAASDLSGHPKQGESPGRHSSCPDSLVLGRTDSTLLTKVCVHQPNSPRVHPAGVNTRISYCELPEFDSSAHARSSESIILRGPPCPHATNELGATTSQQGSTFDCFPGRQAVGDVAHNGLDSSLHAKTTPSIHESPVDMDADACKPRCKSISEHSKHNEDMNSRAPSFDRTELQPVRSQLYCVCVSVSLSFLRKWPLKHVLAHLSIDTVGHRTSLSSTCYANLVMDAMHRTSMACVVILMMCPVHSWV